MVLLLPLVADLRSVLHLIDGDFAVKDEKVEAVEGSGHVLEL